jgi:hypothetical protein
MNFPDGKYQRAANTTVLYIYIIMKKELIQVRKKKQDYIPPMISDIPVILRTTDLACLFASESYSEP